MTRLVGIITKDGIVAAADGRTVDENDNLISDEEIKIYEMSPLCAVMLSGHIPTGLTEQLVFTAALYKQCHIVEATLVAKMLSDGYKAMKQQNSTGWINEPKVKFVMIVAGYDMDKTGNFVPKLYYIQKPDLDIHPPVPQSFAQAGNSYQKTNKFLKDRYKSDLSIETGNKLAIQAIEQAKKDEPVLIGGQTKLWNIAPGKPIKKLSPREIKSLI